MMPTAEAARDPNDLHERARRLLSAGDAATALSLFEQIVVLAPRHLPYWLSLAAALRTLGRHEAELKALERALALDPTHLVVLLQKGALLDLMHKPRSAATVYGNALQTLAPGTRLPEAIEAHVRHAEERVRENAVGLAAAIDKKIGALRGTETGGTQRRFERCLDRILGRRRVYFPEPTFMLFPYLRNYEFFDREHTFGSPFF